MHRSLAVVPLILLSAGCGSSSGEASSDCNLLLRIDGEVYRGAGVVAVDARPLGRADYAACSDGGDSPRGAYFPSNPEQVDTWVLEGHDPRRVVGVRQGDGTYQVFVMKGVDGKAVLDRLTP